MIDPKTVTNYNRTPAELQEWLLYCICVAGKKSEIETRKLDGFLRDEEYGLFERPFDLIYLLLHYDDHLWNGYTLGRLMQQLQKHRIAPYQQRYNSFSDVVRLLPDNLSHVTRNELEAVRGIGPKTSRFFLTHSREDFNEPILDTHILRWLKEKGNDVPSVTPQNPAKYARIAEVFKLYAWSMNKTVADLDLEVWNKYSTT